MKNVLEVYLIMAIGTYEQYKARLLSMKPNVYLNGKKVDRSMARRAQSATWQIGSWAAPM
jgi:4-hydroxyphenylacetate 3-monooxygenase/4-hydroxybutyryl-CoA dehydratase/vinylacetyl-CoA-Delta-isomerase